jgi:hypothetical protein
MPRTGAHFLASAAAIGADHQNGKVSSQRAWKLAATCESADQKAREYARQKSANGRRAAGLLDLGFLERDVLARDRIVFLEGKLVGLGA